MSKYTSKQIIRFWSKVNKNGSIPEHCPELGNCWEWTAGKHAFGYGAFGCAHAKNELSHRAAWIIINGEIPKGLHVLHKCDNPACVNPDHLFLGTQADNNRDRHEKGRDNPRHNECHGMAKLTNIQVSEIRMRYASEQVSYRSLAKIYGVSRTTIYYIVHRTLWKTVK